MHTMILNPTTGKPFDLDALEAMQTTRDARVVQTLRRHPDHPGNGLTPPRLAQIMRDAEQGDLTAISDLACDIEDKSAHAMSELAKRRRAILTIPWSIAPPPNATPEEKADAEWTQAELEQATWFDDLLFDMTDAILKSFSMGEIEWSYQGGHHIIMKVHYREQGAFKTHPDNRNELRLKDGSHEGQTLQDFGWVSHVHRSRSGYIHRAGLAIVIAWPHLFASYSVRDLAEFLEIYGLPLRLGKYPSGAGDREKATLLRAIMAIGHNAGGIIPQGMDIDFKNAAEGQSDPFMAMITWAERSQSKAILGATLTSGTDNGGAYALGSIHKDVMDDICISDARQIAATVTRDIVIPYYVLNGRSYRNPRRMPRFVFQLQQPEDMRLYADALPALAEIMDIPAGWAYDRLQIPVPKAGETLLRVRAQQPATGIPGTAALKATPTTRQPDVVDVLADRMATDSQPVINGWLARIEAISLEAPDLATLKARILEEFSELDDADMVRVMEAGFAVANLRGRSEIDDAAQS